MIDLRFNGAPIPATIGSGFSYKFGVFVNGAEVIPSSWSVVTGSTTVASGHGIFIQFTPLSATAHTISARVVGEFGLFQDVAQTVNVSSLNGQAEAGVNWSKLVFTVGENLTAKIISRDSAGAVPGRIVWTLYRNGSSVFSGEGTVLNFTGTMAGLYRLKGIAYCQDGSQLAFDSTAFIEGSINVRHTLPVTDEGGTMVYIGSVFTQNVAGAAGTATSLPYQIGSSTEDICLLPGTTHWSFDLDPDAGTVDDEVVVRTKKGNWCLHGLGGGLTGESVGYDYGYMPTMIPAPTDHRIRLTVDMFKVHGLNFNAHNARIRVKCYRRLAGGLYRYERCAYSSHPGGEGRRTRRWAAMFTSLDVETDVFSGLNRLGTGTATVAYTTVNTTTVPLMTLSSSGIPNPVQGFSGLYFTDSNLYCYYESNGQIEIAAKALAAIESVRPCCISLLTFNSSKPVISNRIKRVYGELVVFLTEGVVVQGSVVNIKIWKTDGVSSTNYAVPIMATQYANEGSVLLNVGSVPVDLSDYQFNETGVVIDFTVDETAAVETAIPVPAPTPAISPDLIYSPVYSRTVLFDGACFSNPVYVASLDGDAVVVTPIGGCQDRLCGPASLYCYTALDAPAENIVVPQPFGFPAPFVSYGSDPARCFYQPTPLATVNGTLISVAEFRGSQPVDLWSYTSGSYCGNSFAYNACQLGYAPCAAHACSIIVVYPASSSPHASIEYGGQCYVFTGSTHAYGTRTVVPVDSVNPVTDCNDPVCNSYNASGSVVVYNDLQTALGVPVRFDNLSAGTAHYGVAPQVVDNWISGLSDGSKTVTFSTEPNVLVYTSTGTGTMMFEFGLSGIRKQVVVDRGGAQEISSPGIGGSRQSVTLLPGHRVYLRVTDPYGRLPLQYRNLRTLVRWHPLLFLPRLYDTVVVPYSGSSAINAAGFCGYTTQGVYTFYGTLPFNGSMTGPVNPDSIVTVTSGSQEYNLISARAVGDQSMFPLSSLPWYSGQVLNGPFTFKFYAAREAFGAHGEMDVWFDRDGTFPGHLRAGLYDVIGLNGSYHRRDADPADTTRNAYAVVSAGDAGLLRWPNVYTSNDGQVLVADSNEQHILYSGKAFTAPLIPLPYPDPGLSYTIIGASGVINNDTWLSADGDPWMTSTNQNWTA